MTNNTTMAELEWHPNEHFLAEAEHCDYGLVIMFSRIYTGNIECAFNDNGTINVLFSTPDKLTPTGRKLGFNDTN